MTESGRSIVRYPYPVVSPSTTQWLVWATKQPNCLGHITTVWHFFRKCGPNSVMRIPEIAAI